MVIDSLMGVSLVGGVCNPDSLMGVGGVCNPDSLMGVSLVGGVCNPDSSVGGNSDSRLLLND